MYNLKEKITKHLLRLSEQDRYCRFGIPATDEYIEKYVRNLSPTDSLFFSLNDSADVIAFCHLAKYSDNSADLGISVDKDFRGRGLGTSMVRQAVSEAKVKGYDKLYIYYLNENEPMYRLLKKLGASFMPYHDQSRGTLIFERPTIFDVAGNLMSGSVIFMDNFYKQLFNLNKELTDV